MLNKTKRNKKLLLNSKIIDNILCVGWYETENLINYPPKLTAELGG